jgi:hypothetical protein
MQRLSQFRSYKYEIALLRHELMMILRLVPNAVTAEFVDDIFLPLVRVRPAREKKK